MRESKRLKAITLLLQRTWKNSHKLVPCAQQGERKKQNIKKTLFPEKVVIFLLRVGGVDVPKGTCQNSLLVGFCGHTLQTSQSSTGPSSKGGGDTQLLVPLQGHLCRVCVCTDVFLWGVALLGNAPLFSCVVYM